MQITEVQLLMQVSVLLTVYWKFSLVFVFVKYKTLYFFLWCFACHQSLFGIQRLLAIHSSYFFSFSNPLPRTEFQKVSFHYGTNCLE
jgi:hypothetical protein